MSSADSKRIFRRKGDPKHSSDEIAGEAPIQTKLFIGGHFVNSISGKKFATVNPSTGQVICEVEEADKADIDVAVQAAQRAFDTEWKTTDGSRRRDVLLALADLVEYHRDELSRLDTLDNGKPLSESAFDIAECVKCIRYSAGWADKIAGKTLPVEGNNLGFTRLEPVGVVGQIIPWNFPALMLTWKVVFCIACGCTSVLKTAEQTPLSALRFAELCVEAGIPAGVVNIVSGFGATAGAALVDHPLVRKICFTGSSATGESIMRSAARGTKRISLELGGKSPLFINHDAPDLEAAIVAAAEGCFYGSGQVCSAASRLLVHASVYDRVLAGVVRLAGSRKVGDGFVPDTQMGPLVSERQLATVMKYIAAGKQTAKVTVVTGGERVASSNPGGYFVQPTVFAVDWAGADAEQRKAMTVVNEEIFGPVLCVIKVANDDEAIDVANDTEYGLAAGIFTSDLNTALKFQKVRAGVVYVNTYNLSDACAPWGGIKKSGFGRELGDSLVDLFCEKKTLYIGTTFAPIKP